MSTWVPIGPDCVFWPRDLNYQRLSRRGELGRQGLVNSIAIDPLDAATIYTVEAPSTGGNSAFRTDDNGTTWVPIDDQLHQTDPFGVDSRYIAVHPLSTGYVYMGTYSGRVYTSPNSKGDTWNALFANIGSNVLKIIVDPRNASNPSTTIVYAACGSGVWRSTDGAASFSQILNGNLSDFAARFPSDGTPADFYAGIISTGVFYAADPTGPSSWTNLTLSSTSNLPPTTTFDRMLIDTCRLTRRPYVWFINTVNPSSFGQPEATTSLCTAADPTGPWTSISMTSPPEPKYGIYSDVVYDFTFAIAPNSPGDGSNDILLFGEVDVSRSVDSGKTWQDLGRDWYHDDYHAFVFFPDPSPPGVIPTTYIGCDGGLGSSSGLADPSVTFPSPASDDDDTQQYNYNSAVVQNYSHGKQSSAILQYNCDSQIAALGYIGCQDTGINAGDSALLWRGFINADGGSIAVTQGVDGVKVWFRWGEPFTMSMTTDQQQYVQSRTISVALPGGRVVDTLSNYTVDPNGNCLAGINALSPPGTSSAAAIPTGFQVVQPGSMTYIEIGSILTVDDKTPNNAENVTVTSISISGLSFAAVFANSHQAGASITIFSDTSISAPISTTQQTVQPGSMTNIFLGANLTIDTGTAQETVSVTAMSSTTFTANFGNAHNAGAAVIIPIQTLARVDQSGNALSISQNTNGVNIVAVSPTNADLVSMATQDQRLFFSTNATASTPSWTEVTGSKPGGITMASIDIDSSNNIFVLLASGVDAASGGDSNLTPLFRILGTTWDPVACTNLPNPSGFGKLRVDPVQPGVMYAGNGARVYKLTASDGPGTTTAWTDISNNLPGQWINDLWIGNIGGARRPKVLLRAAIPTRGMWELDVTEGASDTPLELYMRDNFMDMARLVSPPDGVPNPYNPSDPSKAVYHYQSADIKVDSQQVDGQGQTFFQIDPESSTLPISHVIFDQMEDNSDTLVSASQAMVHVQVRNRGIYTANNISVWAVYANAGAGLPALNLSPSSKNSFNFWSQFTATGQIFPQLPSDSPWKSVGSPQLLNGIVPSNPQVATWSWTVPTLGSGDPGHYCVAAFVHCSGSPITETRYDVDVITPANKQIAQKNLHISPYLPNGTGGGGGEGGFPKVGRPFNEYIEFHNSTNTIRTSNLVFDLRDLPPQLLFRFMLTPVTTAQPLPGSITGVVSSTGQPGYLNGCQNHHHHRTHHHGHHETCLDKNCPESVSCSCPNKNNPKHDCNACSTFFSSFTPTIYTASPSSTVTISGVSLPPYGLVAAYFNITNTGVLQPGSRYWFNVQQLVGEAVVGGSTYVVRIVGKLPYDPLGPSPQGQDDGGNMFSEILKGLPVWIQRR